MSSSALSTKSQSSINSSNYKITKPSTNPKSSAISNEALLNPIINSTTKPTPVNQQNIIYGLEDLKWTFQMVNKFVELVLENEQHRIGKFNELNSLGLEIIQTKMWELYPNHHDFLQNSDLQRQLEYLCIQNLLYFKPMNNMRNIVWSEEKTHFIITNLSSFHRPANQTWVQAAFALYQRKLHSWGKAYEKLGGGAKFQTFALYFQGDVRFMRLLETFTNLPRAYNGQDATNEARQWLELKSLEFSWLKKCLEGPQSISAAYTSYLYERISGDEIESWKNPGVTFIKFSAFIKTISKRLALNDIEMEKLKRIDKKHPLVLSLVQEPNLSTSQKIILIQEFCGKYKR